MPRLPPELVQRVEDFCSSSDILSFVLVDKSSYRYAIGMLYKCVMLTSKTQIARFSDTMCSNRPCMDLPALRTLPIILYISLPDEATVQPSPEIDHAIMNILHATINILDLILFLPSYDVDRLYQQPGFGPFAFKLIRFTCRTLKPPGFYDFLRQQDEIENLTIHCPGELLETGPVDLLYPASDLLPRLGYLTAGPRSVHQLVPGRPVYAIRILAPLHFSQIEPTILVIAQASVPLLLFDVAIAFNDESECNSYCTQWLSSLSHFRKTLRIIDFLIVPTPDFVARVSGIPVLKALPYVDATSCTDPTHGRSFILHNR
ncbi:hypothetical protein FS749_008371 [Ceratobasidium sp. UAMH 11750]|nr:hypothetical protein FS749_008371 [Ceratobasidium sp. UAMH 11750]